MAVAGGRPEVSGAPAVNGLSAADGLPQLVGWPRAGGVSASAHLPRISSGGVGRLKRKQLPIIMMASLPVLVVIVFMGLPMVFSALYTLGQTGGPNAIVAQLAQQQVVARHGLTLAVYLHLFGDAAFMQDFLATVWVTVASVLIQTLIGWILALYVRFSHGALAKVVGTLYVVPLFIPGVIAAYALVTFWNTGGIIAAVASHLGDPNLPMPGYTLAAVVIGQVWSGIPFSVLLLASGLQAIPDSYLEAARDVGASPWNVFFHILLPLNLLPTVIVLTFTGIGVLGSYTIPYLMGPSAPLMLGLAMSRYFSTYNEPQQAEAMAIIVFLLAALLGVLYVWANLRLDRRGSEKV